ncbi:MAG: hypothetical protein ACLFU0_10680 [Alphaproteobacteria bacterium]
MDFTDGPTERFTPVDGLSTTAAHTEVEALRDAIAHPDHLDDVENAPEIADAAYDRLFHRLEELEAAFAELRSPNPPTQRWAGRGSTRAPWSATRRRCCR